MYVDEQLYFVTQAAAQYTFSVEHLRYLCRTGRVEAQQIGQTWALDQASLLIYLSTERRRGRPRQAQPPDAA